MNEKFYNLELEKQQRIINAGFKVFSSNSYKNSPVGEIAIEAGISKSLLFFYFKNKKELYLFLFEEAVNLTNKALENAKCYDSSDLFQVLTNTMKCKVKLMIDYPYLSKFSLNAYYETNPDVSKEISLSIKNKADISKENLIKRYSNNNFIDNLDLNMMYKEMVYASEGFMYEKIRSNEIDSNIILKEYQSLIDFWKSIYTKR